MNKTIKLLLSLLLTITLLPVNNIKADATYQQLTTSADIESGFQFRSGINRDVNFSNVAVFVDTNVKVHNSQRGINVGEVVTVKIPDGFKYMDGSTYDIYIDFTTSKKLDEHSTWICQTVTSGNYDCLEISPFNKNLWNNDPFVTFDYKIYVLDKDGNDAIAANDIDLTAGSCWTAIKEGARPWGNDNTIYTNIPESKLEFVTTATGKDGTKYSGADVNCWHITDNSYNQLRYYILGHGTTIEASGYNPSKQVTCIKGGYIRNSESGAAEMMFGYFLSASGNDYIGYYDGIGHSISVDTDTSDATITYYKDSACTDPYDDNPSFKDVEYDNGKLVTHTVYYKISGTGYDNTQVYSHTVTIKPLPIAIQTVAHDRVFTYSEDTSVVVDQINNYSTGINNESINISNITGNFNDGNVGIAKPVTISNNYTVSGNNNTNINNYKVTLLQPKASITKASLGKVQASPYIGIYDGNIHNISLTYLNEPLNANNTQGLTFEFYADESMTQPISGYTHVKDNQDSYTVYYKVYKDDNHETITGCSTVTILRKDIYVTPTALDKEKTQDITVEATIVGNDNTNQNSSDNLININDTGISGEALTLYNVTGTFSDTNVGNGKLVTIDSSNKVVDKGNDNTIVNDYNVIVNNTTASIYAGDIYANATSYIGVYDGNYHDIAVTVKDSNGIIIDNPDITFYSDNSYSDELTLGSSDIFIDATYDNGISTFKTIYYKASVTGYDTIYGTAIIMIVPKDIVVNPKADNKEYDGNTNATILGNDNTNVLSDTNALNIVSDITRNENTSNESFSIYGLTGTFDTPDAGDGKLVTIDSTNKVIIPSNGFNESNYNIVINNPTAKITKKKMDVTVLPYDDYYDGQPHGITVTAKDGDNILDCNISYFTDESLTTVDTIGKDVLIVNNQVATKTVYFTVSKENYESVSSSSTVTIRPLEVDINTSANDKQYDGNTNATVNNINSLSTGINDEYISVNNLSGEFIDPNVGNNKQVIVDSRNATITPDNTSTLLTNYYFKIFDTSANIYNVEKTNKTHKSSTSNRKVITCQNKYGNNYSWSESLQSCVYLVTNTSVD